MSIALAANTFKKINAFFISTDPQKVLMREMFKIKPKKPLPHESPLQSETILLLSQPAEATTSTEWTGIIDLATFQSDESSDETDEDDELRTNSTSTRQAQQGSQEPSAPQLPETASNALTATKVLGEGNLQMSRSSLLAAEGSFNGVDLDGAAQIQSAGELNKAESSQCVTTVTQEATQHTKAFNNKKRPPVLMSDNDEPRNGLQIRVPELKRQKLDVSYREQRLRHKKKKEKDMSEAWKAIQALLGSMKTKFVSGQRGLQQRRARAIECHLRIFIKNNRTFIGASSISAEAHCFSGKHGARQLRVWTRQWVAQRVLPTSKRGMHTKMYSLFNDPVIVAELRTFLRSNKWAMNPDKLSQFTQHKLIPSVADEYLRHIIKTEMPKGLKRYMEVVLFPRIHLKVGRGVSISTARRWMRREGFRFESYRKGLYYDGHDRADVVEYRQQSFLPEMERHKQRLVQYIVSDVEQEFLYNPNNYVERRLVLCAHDEMTAQAHDGKAKSWVLDNQHALRKKGVGRGIHQSDIICSTVGWLPEASQTLEYGKNYEGYWTGELFIKQVCINVIQTVGSQLT